jgi:hypothetical protein
VSQDVKELVLNPETLPELSTSRTKKFISRPKGEKKISG